MLMRETRATFQFAATHAPGARRRSAFSLAELMIAIVILGLGFLMIASMFPVAWSRARDLTEFTVHATAAETAETTVGLLGRVTNPQAGTLSSFIGDVALDIPLASIVQAGDSNVHALELSNAFAFPATVGAFGLVWPESTDIDMTNILVDPRLILLSGLNAAIPPPLVSLEQRLIPPLRPRPAMAGPEQNRWDELLGARRYIWSVLYKFDDPVPVTGTETRSVTMFFFTLRRTQSSHRFARQEYASIAPTTAPQALVLNQDMLFPVPWLINLKVIGNWDPMTGDSAASTGVPSEALTNPTSDPAARLIGRMLQPGAILIDRLTGAVYTVKDHRYVGPNLTYDEEAAITLDREILFTDLGLPSTTPPPLVRIDTIDDGTPVMLGGDRRDFWVFPPPVDRSITTPVAFPEFTGKQPVVAVETRQMVFAP